ncbi:MAG: class I SAM-dependent methyltransferase [Candidatus Heimdallarchaeota archaeon]|nr:MAG: class I SAM-dependent methyltransferase [Candidatus Heimdallarchaeota archaeon]
MSNAFGASLLAYWQGDSEAKHIIERDDGYKEEIAVKYLFEKPSEWSQEEIQSLDMIPPNSTILDVGCGVGRIAIYLQNKGHQVVGLDSCREAIKIAEARGLELTFLGNVCKLTDPPLFDSYDVIIMMGNNFGICGDIFDTEQLLTRFKRFLSPNGLLIFSCRDPLKTDKPVHLAYHKQNRIKGRPPGLIKIRICYQDIKDEWWDLLFVTIPTAEEMLKNAGYQKITIYQDPSSPVFYIVAKQQ